MKTPSIPLLVQERYDSFPKAYKKQLLKIRKLIFESAKEYPEIGPLQETLKWGEPSYLPIKSKVGTTIRLSWLKTKPEQYGVYFSCSTNLLAQFKRKFRKTFYFEGKRALIFKLEDPIPIPELKECIQMALLYHLNKKKN